jgi:hypothetical protein
MNDARPLKIAGNLKTYISACIVSIGAERSMNLEVLREYLQTTSIHTTLKELADLSSPLEFRMLFAAGAPGDLYAAAIKRQTELRKNGT